MARVEEISNETLNISSNENGEIDLAFQNGNSCIKGLEVTDTPSSTNVVCTTYGWSEGLGNKTQIFNGGSKKTSQRKNGIKRMHANLSGTKYAVGMHHKNILSVHALPLSNARPFYLSRGVF